MSATARPKHRPRHYPDGSRLRDREGRLWLPLSATGASPAHYIRQGQVGEPALSFRVLATQHGPMVKIPAAADG